MGMLVVATLVMLVMTMLAMPEMVMAVIEKQDIGAPAIGFI